MLKPTRSKRYCNWLGLRF